VKEILVARNSPLKFSLMLLVLLAFLAILVWGPQQFGLSPKPGWEFLRWPGVVVVGLGTIMIGPDLFDRREQIVIASDGIFMRRRSEETIPWSAIARCRVEKQYLPPTYFVYRRHICLYLRDPSLYPPTTRRARFFARFGNLGYGDIIMPIAGLDQEIPEFMAAIEPLAAAAGVEVSRT
jgi:hypothetical protein